MCKPESVSQQSDSSKAREKLSNGFDVCFIFPANDDDNLSSNKPFQKKGEEIVRTLILAVRNENDILIYRSAKRNKSNPDKVIIPEKDENKIIVLIRLSNDLAICLSHIKGFKSLACHEQLKARAMEGWKANDEKNQKKVHPLPELDDRPDITKYKPFEHIYLKYSHEDDFQKLYKNYVESNDKKVMFSRTTKLKILKDYIDDNYEEVDDGINIDLDKVVLPQANGDPPIVLAIFPLHDDEELGSLKRSCRFVFDYASAKDEAEKLSERSNNTGKVPTVWELMFEHFFPWWLDYEAIKNYFGEKIALYYVFTG